MNRWRKCNFCNNSAWDACDFCSNYDNYKPNAEALIESAKENKISVADVIKLIEYCGN